MSSVSRCTLNFFSVFFVFVILVSTTSAEPLWKFIVVGDSRSTGTGDNNGVNIPILSEIASEIVSHGVDFVLFPGDLVYGGVDQTALETQLLTWRNTMQPVYDAGIDVYPVRGNHDVGSPAGTTAWDNIFSGPYALPANGPLGEVGLTYSVTHKNAFILALDQYVTLNRVNQSWIDSQLAANTNPHIFAFGHVPAFKVDHSDCLDDYPTNRDAFWASLKNAGCRTYACGHDHFYDHALVDDGDGNSNNDIHQYLVGTAGAPLRSWSPPYDGVNSGMDVEQWHHCEDFGYILVEVSDSDVTMIWFERDDSGDYAPVIGSPDFDGNGSVNWVDLAIMSDNWLREDCRISNDFCDGADIDQLTTVDIFDFAIFGQDWFRPIPLEVRVSAGSDDAEEQNSTGNMSLSSSDLELVNDPSNGDQIIGMRFSNVNVEQGQQIAGAYIQFTVDETADMNPCSLTIYGQASDNAATFSSDPCDISSRSLTAASVSWNPPAWTVVGQAGADQRTADITSVVQEIVDRPGFSSGNSLVIIIVGSGRRTAESYDGVAAAAPLLHLELVP